MATLVVTDDDPVTRFTIVRILQKEGHTVLAFEDAAPALNEVNFSEVDLVITDLEMPLLGEQFILILRERGIAMPVIVISAYLNEDRTRFLEGLGVHRFLVKPFKVSQLLTLVREIIE